MSAVDKIKNAAQEAAGKVKEAVGEKTDNRDLQAEGQRDQVAGDVKQRGEHVKDAFKR
ncbi:CsbD family protein [Quadrisphaera sp. INWT6]|uniref:CsbD family protein n=1 Tax=Quadrisphaera sp. INWT6 TaxID=2596917 RepID=UPI0018921B07|nr:CsbD family protein [Quadrisphaera sp. INWT6]MBF5082298.1 CsbD family protein [Quadrisphaera sp. INWT6]